MSIRLLRYGAPLLLLPVIACDRAEVTVTSAPTALLSTGQQHPFSFEPATLHPEFLPGFFCVQQPFGTRIVIVISGGDDVILRGMRFRFLDRLGVNALPRVTAIPGSSPFTVPASALTGFPIPTPGLAPLPSTPPIPIPGGSTRTFPFFLTFDCGVVSQGMLFVFIDTADRNGRMTTSELRARLGP